MADSQKNTEADLRSRMFELLPLRTTDVRMRQIVSRPAERAAVILAALAI